MNGEDCLGGRQDNKGWGSSQKGEAKGLRGFRLVSCHSSAGQPPGSRVFEEKHQRLLHLLAFQLLGQLAFLSRKMVRRIQ